MKPAIIIVAFNRTQSLKRLLGSIYHANYDSYSDIPLIISIDGDSIDEIHEIANRFDWQHGKKRIIAHKEHLGLRKHIIFCGDLSKEYDRIIVLEDDLFVSSCFYQYAVNTLNFYGEDNRIAGISLNTYAYNEYAGLPFIPLKNGYDVFFMQIPNSRGQAWTKKQWELFKKYYENNFEITKTDKLPDTVKSWPETSWKKYFYKYVVDKDLYFVYPYISYTTNFGDVGTHCFYPTTIFQVELMNVPKNYIFSNIDESVVVYDGYMELLPECFWRMGIKKNIDFCVDVYGTKQLELFNNEYCFSTKECADPIEKYGIELIPVENNILYGFEGDKISFCKRIDCEKKISVDLYDHIASLYDRITYDRGYQKGHRNALQTRSYKIGHYFLLPLIFFRTIKRKLFRTEK